jgi:hypothetical protein
VQVVLGDRRGGADRGVQHRGGAPDPARAARLGEHVEQEDHLGVAIRQGGGHMQLPGPKGDPPVDPAQPVTGSEDPYAGQLAALTRATRVVGADQPGGPGHRLHRVERFGLRIDPDPDRFTDHRTGDQQPVGRSDPGAGRPDRVPSPAQRRPGQSQVDGRPGKERDEGRSTPPAGRAASSLR